MGKIFSHKRFALFAPFMALCVLAVMGFALWVFAAGRIVDELSANGFSWQKLTREGFPARISLYMDAPRWHGDDVDWQNQGLSMTLMPFKGGHAIIDFLGPHFLKIGGRDMQLAHQGNLMSVVVDGDGVNRASFEADKADLRAARAGFDWRMQATRLGVHMRRRDDARHDIALVAKQPVLAQNIEAIGGGSLRLSRLEAMANVSEQMLARGLAAGDVVGLDRLTLARKGLTVIAKGRVKLRANGYLDGSLDLDVVNLKAFADALVEFGLINKRDKRKLLLLGGLGAALGGDTQDRLSLPLRFQNKRLYLGRLELGAAPKWQ
ncbi:MAG: DUF2125 domain-containing protein [Parvibaculales bacterium]